MTKQISKHETRSRGVTLVELLVVVSILSVVAAVLIPRLRVINKDRNVREASRMVASAFAKATTRAISEGTSGLVIVPNRNFLGGTGVGLSIPGETDNVQFAGTRIFQMRRMPPYLGDDETHEAEDNTDAMTQAAFPYQIQKPFEHDFDPAGLKIIQPFDEISFSGSSYRYLITAVGASSTGSDLVFSIDNGSAPAPNLTNGVSFVVHRQPRRMRSSMVELPDGYMIDLRYSGRSLSGSVINGNSVADYGTACNQNVGNEIEIHFNASGGVERMFFNDQLQGAASRVQARPLSQLYWFVSHFEPSAFDGAGVYKPGRDPIMSPTNKWVTLDPITGSVNVASNRVPTSADAGVDVDGDGVLNGSVGTLSDYIFEAQTIARTRQSANQ